MSKVAKPVTLSRNIAEQKNPKMLDKLKFNNLVISSSKDIEKARIHIVRKIINRMRKLKLLLDKQPNNASNVIKLRKCVAIADCVKKIKRVDIMNHILLLEKSPSKIITNSYSKPEEVGVAMLAANKTIQTLALRFRQELCLKESEFDEWKKNLNEISKIKAKKERRKKRKAHMQSKTNPEKVLKKSKSEKNKGKINVTETKKENSSVNNNKYIISDDKESQIKEKFINNLNGIEKKVKTTTKTIKNNAQKDLEINEANEELHQTKDEEKVNIDKEFAIKKIKNNVSQIERDTSKPKPEYYVDPFFMTETGENYLASVLAVTEKTTSTDKTTKDGHIISKLSHDSKIKEADYKPKSQENHTYSSDLPHDYKRKEANYKSKSQKDANIHPSWEAKQKQKTFSVGQGKKTVFEDSGETSLSKKMKKESHTEKLHPSWAAKQKLKPTIANFQGKKITFGDDE